MRVESSMEAALSWSDRYQIIKEIAGSKHSRVYLVYDNRLGVRRILKEISGLTCQRADHGCRGDIKDRGREEGSDKEGTDKEEIDKERTDKEEIDKEEMEELRQHFISELHIAKELHHPNIPMITDLLVEEGSIRILMEYIEGENLQVYVREKGRIGEEILLNWAFQLTDILRYLHSRNPPVIHRDIKPANIICHPSGRLYLLDYGISGQDYGYGNSQNRRGSPGYAAPEQYDSDRRTDCRTDIYGLGRTLLFCACGEAAPGEEKDAVNDGICSQELLLVLSKCISPCPEDRYHDVMELEEELFRLKKRREQGNRVRKKEAAGIFLLLGMILIAVVACLLRNLHSRIAAEALECARENWNQEEILSDYRRALSYAPWMEEIYESILEEYVIPNHFTAGEAVELLNVLEDTHALSVYKRQNLSGYARFCYGMGIGYFYYMGGIRGKQEAAIWFDRASDSSGNLFDERKQKRLECYQLISEYYRTFLTYGQDESGESEEQSYGIFFSTLQKLRHNSIDSYTDLRERSSLSEEAGTVSEEELLCMIAMEIAMEIRDHAEDFLSEEEITAQLLLEELDHIDIVPYLPSEDGSQYLSELEQLLHDARKSVQIMEGRDRKKNE